MLYKFIDIVASDVLPIILEMSLVASITIFIVMILRFILTKAPKVFSYMLWSIVMFRLLCPVSLGSPFSVFNFFESVVDTSSNQAIDAKYESENTIGFENELTNQQDYNLPNVLEYQNQELPNQIYDDFDNMQIVNDDSQQHDSYNVTAGKVQDSSANDVAEENDITVFHILSVVWIIGMVLFGTINVINLAKLKRKLSASINLRKNIFISDEIDMPFCFGIINPKIYLPSTLKKTERKYVIAHERAHIRRMDHIVKPLAYIALGIHWFNPLVWIAFVLAGKDMEMSCDEKVISKLGEDIRAEYSAILLGLATGKHISIVAPLSFGEGNPKGRITNIMNYKRPRTWVVTISVIVCIIALLCLVTNPIENAAETSDATQSTSSENNINIENSENVPISINLSQYYITNIGDPSNLYKIDDDKILWGCGQNNYGQLGQGTQDYDFHDEFVKIAENAIHVDYSQHGFTIYLTDDHKLYGVGNAATGALLQYESFDWDKYINGEHYTINTPVLLMENVVYARCGRDDIVCLTEDGEVWTWGTIAIEGGYPSTDVIFYSAPQKIFDNAIFITGGWFNHAVLRSDGTVWTWGYNSAGNCGVENPTVISEPIMVADNVKMVWTGYTQTNSKEQSISEFEGIYPVFINNTIICKADDTFWICGENVGTEEKVVHGAEGDYTVAFSSEFVPYDSNQYTEEERDLLIEDIKEKGMSAEKTQYEQLYSMCTTCENPPKVSGTWNRTNVYSSESSILEIENVDDNGYDFLIRAQFADHSGCVEGRAYFISEHCAIYRLDEIDVGILPETEYEYVLFVFEDDGVNIYASANSAEMNLGMHVDVAGYYISDVPEYID